MDWGQEAFFDTIEALKGEGISVIGVGKNIEEARKPAILESKGSRVAFLAYNTILPMGYWADANRPGCAPMRAWTLYEQIEHDQPGTPAGSTPSQEDSKQWVRILKGQDAGRCCHLVNALGYPFYTCCTGNLSKRHGPCRY
jgi:poly-gamma-glutamate synthesis protein (capsule biosynthesis protein)